MKYLLLLLSSLIINTSSAQRLRPFVYFYKDSFCGIYSEIYEQPIWVSYSVDCTRGKFSRKGMRFKTDYWIYTSDNNDYTYNIWDKGHLVPAENFSCSKKDMMQTFTYLNCALQHEGLNRGKWKSLENLERRIAERECTPIYVEVDVHFSRHWRRLPSGAKVPSGFTKHIIVPGRYTKCFYFPNYPARKSLNYYIINCRKH